MSERPKQERRFVAASLIRVGDNIRSQYDSGHIAALRDSIATVGVLQDLQVTPAEGGTLELVAGHCRYLAGLDAGLAEFPCVVHYQLDSCRRIALQLIENTLRRDMNPMELARGYEALVQEERLPVNRVAEKHGLEQSVICKYRQLLSFDEETQRRIEAGGMSFTEAYNRCKKTRIAKPDRRKRVAFKAAGLKLTAMVDSKVKVKALREWATEINAKLASADDNAALDRWARELA